MRRLSDARSDWLFKVDSRLQLEQRSGNRPGCRAFTEAFDKGNLAALEEMFAPDMVDHSTARGSAQTGLEGFKQRIAGHRRVSPTCTSPLKTCW